MKLKRSYLAFFAFLAIAIILTSCAPGNEKFTAADPAGFFMGLWHGFISLITFIISLFNDKVFIYEAINSGWPYDLGFILGISIFYGGASKSSCRS